MEINEITIKKLIKFGAWSIIILVVLSGAFFTVKAGHRGVLLTFGKPSEIVYGEGIHFKVPIAQKAIKMEVRTQKIEVTADSSSKDLQDVQTTIALNFNVIPEESKKLYQNIGLSYLDRVVKPAIEEGVRAVTAKYTAEQLITKRAEVRDEIKEFLKQRLLKSHIQVTDFNIVNFQFSEEFDNAIEQKVTAEQLKLKAEWDLERIKVEKEQKITEAEAQAEALRIQKQEVTAELIELRKIEMMMAAITKWDGKMPEATSGMPFIDITPSSKAVISE